MQDYRKSQARPPISLANRSLDRTALDVLARFSIPHEPNELETLGNHGGFSGAQLWRVTTAGGEQLCLRAWPAGQMSEVRLAGIHRWMRLASAAGLAFVPLLHCGRDGSNAISSAERLWELAAWMPGIADFHARPSVARLEAACAALARLHLVWSRHGNRVSACPAVERRLHHVADWRQRAASGWQIPIGSPGDLLHSLSKRAWDLVRPRLESLERTLSPWLERPLPAQPCLCDIWHDHVLFESDRISGLIDYGAMKIDSVAVDLARMLGSLVEDNAELRNAGLRAYGRIRPLSLEEDALVGPLDEATVVLGAANWLKWLYVDKKEFENLDAVAQRLAQLAERLERRHFA